MPTIIMNLSRSLATTVFLILFLNSACYAQSGGGILSDPTITASEKIDQLTEDLENIKQQLRDINHIVQKSTRLSNRYTSQAKAFEKVVDAHLVELGSCKAMATKYEQMNAIRTPSNRILKLQERELDKCARRVANSTIEHSDAGDFLNNILTKVNELKAEAEVRAISAEGLEASREKTEAAIEFWRSTFGQQDEPSQYRRNPFSDY